MDGGQKLRRFFVAVMIVFTVSISLAVTPIIPASRVARDWSSLTAADVDRDGKLDLVAASRRDGKIRWFENADGSLIDVTEHEIARFIRGASAVAVGDLDIDGDADVVSAAGRDGKVYLHDNRDGSFGNRLIARRLQNITALAVADVDKDGDFDVIVGAKGKGIVIWLENVRATGEGMWPSHDVGAMPGVEGLAVGDINLDGAVDVAVVSDRGVGLRWFRNERGVQPSFSRHDVAVDGTPYNSVTIADIDADGQPDILAGSTKGKQLTWFRNQGNVPNSFTSESVSGEFSTVACLAMDINKDGKCDIIASDGGLVGLFENVGARNAPSFMATPQALGMGDAAVITLGDMDRDGDSDIVAGGLKALWWSANLTSHETLPPVTRTRVFPDDDFTGRWSAVSDLDLDGDADLVSVTGGVSCLGRNSGGNAPTFSLEPLSSFNEATLVGDMDGDGDDDIVQIQGNQLVWLENQRGPASEFVVHPTGILLDESLGIPNISTAMSPAVDVDHDGDLDFFLSVGSFAGQYSSPLQWVENRVGDGDVMVPHGISAENNHSQAIGDFNNDGWIDIATSSDGRVSVLLSDRGSLPGFTISYTSEKLPTTGQGLCGGDFDSDGDTDIAVSGRLNAAYPSYGNLVLLENTNGSGSHFLQRPTISHYDAYFALWPGDFDLDGDIDLIGSIGSVNGVGFFRNQGTGVVDDFDLAKVDTPEGGAHIAFGDIGGNGIPDMIASILDGWIEWWSAD